MTSVVFFCFAGRYPNMAAQLPLMRRALDLVPDSVYHVWNLGRLDSDREWLASYTDPDPRIQVSQDAVHLGTGRGMRAIWQYYGSDPAYRDTVFVKLDDDVTFFDVSRIGQLVAAVRANPKWIISADVVNNGTADAVRLGCDGFAVHTSAELAAAAHDWFFQHWRAAVSQPVVLEHTALWVSINMIGLTQRQAQLIFKGTRGPCPEVIAGWRHGRRRAGDEGAANMLPHAILRGVMACHLSFSPQLIDDATLDGWRDRYRYIADRLQEQAVT